MTISGDASGSIQPHRLYSIRGGRLIAARHVGCITCVVEWYPPKRGTPHCSGGNLPPPGPQGRNRGTFLSVKTNGKTFIIVWGNTIQQNGLYLPRCQPLAGAGWRWVNAATFIPYIGFYHSPAQVVFATWRAADCRPYIKIVTNTAFFAHLIWVSYSGNSKNVIYCSSGRQICRPLLQYLTECRL